MKLYITFLSGRPRNSKTEYASQRSLVNFTLEAQSLPSDKAAKRYQDTLNKIRDLVPNDPESYPIAIQETNQPHMGYISEVIPTIIASLKSHHLAFTPFFSHDLESHLGLPNGEAVFPDYVATVSGVTPLLTMIKLAHHLSRLAIGITKNKRAAIGSINPGDVTSVSGDSSEDYKPKLSIIAIEIEIENGKALFCSSGSIGTIDPDLGLRHNSTNVLFSLFKAGFQERYKRVTKLIPDINNARALAYIKAKNGTRVLYDHHRIEKMLDTLGHWSVFGISADESASQENLPTLRIEMFDFFPRHISLKVLKSLLKAVHYS
ncbi:uncharacterized protein L3040_008768 [Drepanopeziza brunnea f. sp. 'multigermtubi']|uniref:uncharacterized protein n=1 Tax=Drepanopeziza brunnea f. sp. 'multigermtubi' TaxID=698441 RepID=UPI0023944984|nr:hypothetical protein L3040_008768 [Drepanopeziza brunnea f. sp. 'multigermtubi']